MNRFLCVVAVVGALPLAACQPPDCDRAAQRLIDLCSYDEYEAQLYYNACTAYEIGGSLDMEQESRRKANCILRSGTCEAAEVCHRGEVETEGEVDLDTDGDGYVEGDCDEGNASIYPGAPETADDGIDQDCNGADATACFGDDDGDGFGAGPIVLGLDGECGAGLAAQGGDCNDSNAGVNPAADEVPDNEIDDNCDGIQFVTCYWDLDEDDWGGLEHLNQNTCDDFMPRTDVGGDCDDDNPDVNPGADEVPGNGVDDDCDGNAD